MRSYTFAYRHDFQFFNTQRLSELYEKEVRYLMVSVRFLSVPTLIACVYYSAFLLALFFLLSLNWMAQQTHQKNQLKDTIDVEETEGMLLTFMFQAPIFIIIIVVFFNGMANLEMIIRCG